MFKEKIAQYIRIYWPALVLFIIVFCLYSYQIVSTFRYDSDFARDLSDVLDISRGDIRLIGPKSSFGGIYSPPYYYYLFLPVFLISKSIASFLFFNVFMFAIAVTLVCAVFIKKYGVLKACLSAITLSVMPLYLFASRNPGNFAVHLPFLLILFLTLLYGKLQTSRSLLIMGFFSGITLTFDYAELLLLPAVIFYIWYFLKQKRQIWFIFLGFLIALSPLILFEFTHQFIMLKNTFINQSYLSFVQNTNLGGTPVQRNVIETLLFVNNRLVSSVGISTWLITIIGGTICLKNRKWGRKEVFFGSAVFSFGLLLAALHFQYADHYLYPVAFMLVCALAFLIVEKSIYFITIFALIIISNFPISVYNQSSRPYGQFENIVASIIDQKLITKNDRFNILQIRLDTALTTSAHEYRFFFKKRGLEPNTIDDYKTAQKLIIFSEDPNLDIAKVANWEMNQFKIDNEIKIQQQKIKDLNIFILTK